MNTINETGIDNLLKWSKENGATVSDSLSFKYHENHGISCIYTQQDTNSDQCSIFAPESIIISGSVAKTWLEKYLNHSVSEENTSILLIWFLCLSRFGTESEKLHFCFHQPYVQMLPKVIDTPLIWSTEQLEPLVNTNIAAWRTEKLSDIYSVWKESLQNIFQETEEYTDIDYESEAQSFEESKFATIKSKDFAAYLWAYTIVTSRSFPEYVVDPTVEDKSRCVLLPLIDLLNHNPRAKVEWCGTSSDLKVGFSLNTPDTFEDGDEVFNNYGAKSNEELLTGYGFVLEENNADYFPLRLKLDENTIEFLLANGVNLFTASDYSTNAFEYSKNTEQIEEGSTEKKISDLTKEGALFFLKKGNPDKSIENLVNLFSVLTTGACSGDSLHSTVMGIKVLYQNVERKLEVLPDLRNLQDVFKNNHRFNCAMAYVSSSKKILKYTLKYLKALETKKMSKKRDQYITFENLVQDPEILQKITDSGNTDMELELDFELLVVLFLLCHLPTPEESRSPTTNGIDEQYVKSMHIRLSKMNISITESQISFFLDYYEQNSLELLDGETVLLLNV